MKIVYCLNSISHTGGIATVTMVKANALAEIEENEVFVVVTDHMERGEASLRLSDKVGFVDLDVDYYADDWKSRWHVLKGIIIKRRIHKRRLTAVLEAIKPDVVISVGQSEKYLLPEIKGDWVRIRELHFRKDFRLLRAETAIGKAVAVLSNIYDYCYKGRRYDHIVTLTDEDRERNWKNSKNLSVIPNALTFAADRRCSADSKTIIAVGRLEHAKNFASLIRAFAVVAERHPDRILEIYGDGDERRMLQSLIEELRLERNVHLCGSTNDVQGRMCDSSLFVLSSRYEGLPLVMLEAMSCGLPVVSYDCPCGPKDIITDGVDGFLVPSGNEEMLAERICRLIENPELRIEMGGAALKKSEQYRTEKIIPMWLSLFERLTNEKRNVCSPTR